MSQISIKRKLVILYYHLIESLFFYREGTETQNVTNTPQDTQLISATKPSHVCFLCSSLSPTKIVLQSKKTGNKDQILFHQNSD